MYCRPQPEIFGDLPARSLVGVERKIYEFPTATRTPKACPFLDVAARDKRELVWCHHRPVW